LPSDQVKRRKNHRNTALVGTFLLAMLWPVYYVVSHLYWKPYASQASLTSALLEELYGAFKIPVAQDNFTSSSGAIYSVQQVHWSQPLGKQILILDVDTRPLNASGQYLHDPSESWDLMDFRATGLLNHYLYGMSSQLLPIRMLTLPAQIHGYEYKFMRADVPATLAGYWVKVLALREKLKDYRIVVVMDGDALWNYPEIPLEWLMNHWDFTSESSLAISSDPTRMHNSHGDQQANTGFIIAQQSDRTTEIMDAWLECPTGKRHPGCERYAVFRFHEQQAFNDYVRYDFNRSRTT